MVTSVKAGEGSDRTKNLFSSSPAIMLKNTVNCLKCGKRFESSKTGTIKEKKFCSAKCRTRYNSVLYYYKVRNSEVYKAKAKFYLKRWIKNNPEKFRKLALKNNLAFQKRNYDKGLCRCGKTRFEDKVHCEKCLIQNKLRMRRCLRARKKVL